MTKKWSEKKYITMYALTIASMAIFASSVFINIFMSPKVANAQAGSLSSSLAVPISTSYDYNITMEHAKDFWLDKLATNVIKALLHKMTMNIVDWINSGFNDSPAFLTNPEGFFLDTADQLTGAFLSTEGPLSQLCSPFSVDIRLSLALDKAALIDQPYKCTLGKIIDNLSNIDKTPIYVNGQNINTNKATMEGFLGGDFSQGGWSAFLALTTEPQNNPYGAYLQAQSDLNSRINARQNAIKVDLQMGRGFLSWQDCKDITDAQVENSGLSDDQFNQLDTKGSTSLGNNTSMKTVYDESTGEYKMQNCTTETPGSVIENSLTDALGSPMREMEVADDINTIINALVSQLMTKVLNQGLRSVSSSGSYGNSSYVQDILNEDRSNQAQSNLSTIQSQIGPAMDNARARKSYYDQAVTLVKEASDKYEAVWSCLNTKVNGSGDVLNNLVLQGTLSSVETELNNNITPLLTSLLAGQKSANDDMANLQSIANSISSTGSVNTVQNASDKYSEYLQSGGLNASSKLEEAQSALGEAQSKSATWNMSVVTYENSCNSANQ